MDREIGEKFKLELTLKVVENEFPCEGCIFRDCKLCILMTKELGYCNKDFRHDGKHVHFEIDDNIL